MLILTLLLEKVFLPLSFLDKKGESSTWGLHLNEFISSVLYAFHRCVVVSGIDDQGASL